MIQLTRRTFFTGVSIVAVAGCTTADSPSNGGGEGGDIADIGKSDADDDGVPDSEDEYPNDANRSSGDTKSGTGQIGEDQWLTWNLDFTEQTHLEYEMLVRDGPSVDVFLFDENEYEYYSNQERAKYYSALSDLDTIQPEGRGWLESGDYVLVIDNTNYGEAQPPTNFDDDVAKVEYELTVSR